MAAEGNAFQLSQVVDTSGLLGNLSAVLDWGDGTSSAGTITKSPAEGTIRFKFDYSLDTGNFFNTQAKRDLLQLAGDAIGKRFSDQLTAISSGGTNRWTADFVHPATGLSFSIPNLVVASNEIIVYAGARDLPGADLGRAFTGGFNATGNQAFFDLIRARGQAGALSNPPTDYAVWGGSIAFDSIANWHFGTSTVGLDTNENDFLSIATHELAHLMGFGLSGSWRRLISGTNFNGTNSIANYDQGGQVPLESDGSHWRNGTLDSGSPTLMDPTIDIGTRKLLTRLDLAGLQDVGWSLITPQATVTAEHFYPDNGNYQVQVGVSGSRMGNVEVGSNASISNAQPVLTVAANKTAFVNQSISIVDIGQFTDGGFDNPLAVPPTTERFRYQIDWGDGSVDSSGDATIDSMGAAGRATVGSFDGSHTYSVIRLYTVTVVVTDDDGGTSSKSFTIDVQTPPALQLSLSRPSIIENDGAKAAVLTVRRLGPSSSAVSVALSSSDTTEARLPATVNMAAGVSEVAVDVEAIDDSLLDGRQTAVLAASAVGYTGASINVLVEDFELVSGVFSVTSFAENAGSNAATLTVKRSNTDRSNPIVVSLTNRAPNKLSLASTVTIAAGLDSATIDVGAIDNATLDGTVLAQVDLSSPGYIASISSVTVTDFEPIDLVVTPATFSEEAGKRLANAKVTIPFAAPSGGLTVDLSVDQAGQLTVPTRIVVPAGAREANFSLEVVNDYRVESTMSVQLRATNPAMISAAVDLVINDDDLPIWRNPVNRFDVNNDRVLNAIDALVIINRINAEGAHDLVPGTDVGFPPYVDPNGDGILSPIDVLVVINELNRLSP